MQPSSSHALDALLEQCILALEAGDRDRLDAVLTAHPADAAELRARLDRLASLGMLQSAAPARAFPEQLGEFRLLHPIGRGGMGVVFLAEQTALRRHVALKLVHPEHLLFDGARERFRREVLAIARLQHPGIVPILTSGEAEGVPFYAMELVHGASLSQLLLRLAGTRAAALDGGALRAALVQTMAERGDAAPVGDGAVFRDPWSAVCARIVRDAALALQHAHEHGVLHRDVKPSNLLLTAAGQVRVIDFGLASAEGEQRITRSRATLGSLPYMAPEQVRGDAEQIDARTDVYALGVVLYELLTLTPPHGDGSGATRERILAGAVAPPLRHNANVPADLDAICLMAMAHERSRRYATAADLADDLLSFLEQRAVRARRPSWALRVRRWARRHPGRAAALSVVALVLVPGPTLLALQQHAAAGRIRAALDVADAERRTAEHNFEQALLAVEQMLFRTATVRLAEHPRTAALRRSLLEDAIAFHERLLAGVTDDARDRRVRADRARTQIRLGRLHVQLGDLPRAVTLLSAGIDALDRALPQVAPTQRSVVRMELANACQQLGEVEARMDHKTEEERLTRRALDLFAQVLADAPHQGRALAAQNDCRLALASSLARQRRFDEARALLDVVAADVAAPPPADLPPDLALAWRLHPAHVADQRGALLALSGETELAIGQMLEGLAHLDALPDDLRQQPDARRARVSMLERLGDLGLQRREWERATGWLDAAAAALEADVARDPDLPGYRAQLAGVLSTRAASRRELLGPSAALADHDRAVTLLQQVVAEAPRELEYQRQLAIAFGERAGSRFATGEAQAALADLESAEAAFQRVLDAAPDDETTRSNLAATLANHARTLARMRDLDAARALADRAIELAGTRDVGENQRARIELYGLAADLAMQQSDLERGAEFMERATELATRWLEQRREDPLRQATMAMVANNRGTMFLQRGDRARAREIWEGVLATARAAAPQSPFGRQVLAILLLRLADVAARDGDVAVARDWFRAARAETGVTQAQVRGFAPLAALFDRADFRDLLQDPPPTDR